QTRAVGWPGEIPAGFCRPGRRRPAPDQFSPTAGIRAIAAPAGDERKPTVKRAILPVILIVAVIGGGVIWLKTRAAPKAGDEKSATEKPGGGKSEETHVSLKRDENGRVVVSLDDKTRKNMGLQVAHPAAATFSLELKGYGRALDPAPLAALMTELASAQAAYAASSNELARLKTLEG